MLGVVMAGKRLETLPGTELVERIERVDVRGGVGGESGVSDPLDVLDAMLEKQDFFSTVNT